MLSVSYPPEWMGITTKGAAIGYLGKACLFTQGWAKAENEFKQLMSAPFQYDLLENYALTSPGI